MKKIYETLSIPVEGEIIMHHKNLSLENIEGEIWKDILGYETLYQVSNFGRVKSLKKTIRGSKILENGEYCVCSRKEIIRKQKIDKYGYNCVNLSKRTDGNSGAQKKKFITIHRLVAMAFVPNPENKSQINHKNGVKYNNVPENLQWSTIAENNDHAINVLHRKTSTYWAGKTGKDNATSKPVLQCDLKGNVIREFESVTSATEFLGVGRASLASYFYRLKKSKDPSKVQSYGYRWKFKEKEYVRK